MALAAVAPGQLGTVRAMSEKDIVQHDKEELEHLEEDLEAAKRHLAESTHEHEHYFYEDSEPKEGKAEEGKETSGDSNAPG